MKTLWGDTIWFAVYGIFRKEKCLYVGSSKNWFYREQDQKRRFGKRVEFRVLKYCLSETRARTLESKFIRKYKKQGEAKFNIYIG